VSRAASTVYVDLRCLQNESYRSRGIGSHAASLLRSRFGTQAGRFRLTGLIDPELSDLPLRYRDLCDAVTASWNPLHSPLGAMFACPSPMTNDPALMARLLGHRRILSAAVIHDFIPLDWHGYLNSVSSRIDYTSKLISLKSFDLFFPNSNYSGNRLRALLGISRSQVQVTGVAARSVFWEKARTQNEPGPARSPAANPYFLVVSGPDPRKNLRTAVKAISLVNRYLPAPVPLRIVGMSKEVSREEIYGISDRECDPSLLQFSADVSDEELADCYAGALATIVPSHIEGFSMPVVEASACGCPVIASRCAAHLELIDDLDCLFASESPEELSNRLRQVLFEPGYRERSLRAQSGAICQFQEGAVAARFWNFLCENFDQRFGDGTAASVNRASKPRLAFLSPYLPDQSGVARFTQRTLEAASKRFEIDLFTNAPRPIECPEGIRDRGRINISAFSAKRYDGVISVLGNSDFHTPIFELFEKFGGPCILHDSRLTQIYRHRLGDERFRRFAVECLGRPVTSEEIAEWLGDRNIATLFVDPIVRRASPLIVHTHRFQQILRERYGVDAEVTTGPPNVDFEREELTETNRAAARRRLGINPNTLIVSTFGFAGLQKGSMMCIMAMDLLRRWRVPAELFFVGSAQGLEPSLRNLATELDIADSVHIGDGFVEEPRYRDFLLASDTAVQLRTYGLGQFSAALTDCIGASIPTVATAELAESVDAPSYVQRIPDHISPLLVAERIAQQCETYRSCRETLLDERDEYCRLHSFTYYAQRLEEILAL